MSEEQTTVASATEGNNEQEESEEESETGASGTTKDPDELRQMGNHQFAQGNYDVALLLYSQALAILSDGKDNGDDASPPTAMLLNLCNRSACYFQMEHYEEARIDAAMAWKHAPELSNIKAAYRLAKTLIALENYTGAEKLIEEVFGILDAAEQQQNSATVESADDDNNNNMANIKTQRKAFRDLQHKTKQQQQAKNEKVKVSIRDFQLGKELGFGNFSEIYEVTHKVTKKKFALKRINKKKAQDLANRQHPNVHNEIHMERRILAERLSSTTGTQHPFIVQMHAAFDDYEHIYYCMDLHVRCGDLWSRLKYVNKANGESRHVGCHRSQTKMWMYQLVDTIEHMHSHGIVHRDLKPENILLDDRNHVVVIDFGTAKDLILTELNGPEFVGTPDFMSPEAVKGGRNENKDKPSDLFPDAGCPADLWALGAIGYILHSGETPFWSPSPFLAFLKIKRCQLRRSWGIADDDAWDFISKLMKVDPQKRFGAHVFECVEFKGGVKRVMRQNVPGRGYDCLREHPYLNDFHEQTPQKKVENPVPSLRDLSMRAVVELLQKDSIDFGIMEKHPPGDKSSHDMLRLDPRDRKCVMHLCDKLRLFKAGDAVGQQPRLYSRFFDDIVECRLFSKFRERQGWQNDFCGLSQMNDDHGKPPSALNEDPYATPLKVDPVSIAFVSNPLFCSGHKDNEGVVMDDETRKKHKKDLKKCIAAINRTRPKMVVINGSLEESKKLLARISDSIPVLANDGMDSFYQAWYWGVQVVSISAHPAQTKSTKTPQLLWLREVLEESRMSKPPLFVFCDGDPRYDLPEFIQKRLARGKVHCLIGHCHNPNAPEETSFKSDLEYDHKTDGVVHKKSSEKRDDDDISIRSNDSDDDEKDDHTVKVMGCRESAIRWVTVEESGDWKEELELMQG